VDSDRTPTGGGALRVEQYLALLAPATEVAARWASGIVVGLRERLVMFYPHAYAYACYRADAIAALLQDLALDPDGVSADQMRAITGACPTLPVSAIYPRFVLQSGWHTWQNRLVGIISHLYAIS